MSTKIYNAYRIPTKRINEFLLEVGDSVLDKTVERLQYFSEILGTSKDYLEKLEKLDREHSNQVMWAYILMYHIKPAARSLERSMFDIESAVNLYIDGSKTYCVFYFQVEDVVIPDYAEEYSYWNNTDRPENISSGRWERRSKNWDRVVFNKPATPKITHLFVNANDYQKIYELEKRFLADTTL